MQYKACHGIAMLMLFYLILEETSMKCFIVWMFYLQWNAIRWGLAISTFCVPQLDCATLAFCFVNPAFWKNGDFFFWQDHQSGRNRKDHEAQGGRKCE